MKLLSGKDEEDWRLTRGQKEYLLGATLHRESVRPNAKDLGAHKHCELCWATFSPYKGDEQEGYVTEDGQYWICDSCYRDFEAELKWKIKDSQ